MSTTQFDVIVIGAGAGGLFTAARLAHRGYIMVNGQITLTGVHAGCGSHSYLVAFGDGVDTMDWADPGQEDGTTMPWQRSTLVLRHEIVAKGHRAR